MLSSISLRLAYLAALWREGLWGKMIGAIYFVAGLFIFFRDDWWRPKDEAHWKLLGLALRLSAKWWLLGAAVMVLAWAFEGSFRLQKRLKNQVTVLSKIDRRDIETLLNGRFIGNHFLYGGGDFGRMVKNYDTEFKIRELASNDYDAITAPVPRNSVVTLDFQFRHSRALSGGYRFYLRNGLGEVHSIEDIYAPICVLVGETAQFGLRLSCDPDFNLSKASLMVTVAGWTK